MANFRRLVSAMALSVMIGAGMVVTGPTVHAAAPGSDQSISVRCRLLQAALSAAQTLDPDSALVAYLEGQVAAFCAQAQ